MQSKHNQAGAALSSLARVTDEDWPGVVSMLGEGWRLAVNGPHTRYVLQRHYPERRSWSGRSFARLSTLRASDFAATVPGLQAACEGLPESPADVLPELKAAHAEMLGGFQANDWRKEDYGRVIRRQGNLRVVVEPSGEVYRLQWIAPKEVSSKLRAPWVSLCKSERAQDIARFILERVYDVEAESGERESVQALALWLGSDLPPLARDGKWPVLPERPATVR